MLTIDDGLEPAEPFWHSVGSEVTGDENAFDHETDVVQFGLRGLPELLVPKERE
jgi:hypothetical protein